MNWSRGMAMDDRIYYITPPRCGKSFLKRLFIFRCKQCGAELPSYPCYDDKYELRICKKCGMVHRTKRMVNLK